MRFAALFLFSLIFSGAICAEPITFGFSREGVGYEAVDKPQLLNLIASDTLYIITESGREFPITITRFSSSLHGNLLVSGSTSSGDIFSMVVTPEGSIFGSLREGLDFYRLDMLEGNSAIALRATNIVPESPDENVYPAGEPPLKKIIDVGLLDSEQGSVSEFQQMVVPVYRSGKATIDVAIYYDTNLRDHQIVIDYTVELANEILRLTDVGAEFRVVVTKPIEIPLEITNDDLINFIATDEGVANDRKFYRADLAHAIRARKPETYYTGNCGLAPYAVVNGVGRRSEVTRSGMTLWNPGEFDNWPCPDYTLLHELGHNLGSAHDREQCAPGGCNSPAYPYSYGKRESGVFKTIMAYGADKTFGTFSTPEYGCGGYSCGEPPSSQNSADNRRSIMNTKHLVAGFEGQGFRYESVQEFADSGICVDGRSWEGVSLVNSSSREINIRAITGLGADGNEYGTSNFEKGEQTVEPGGISGIGTCEGLFGTDIREAYLVYENPVTGALVEGRHVFFDESYSGAYSFIKIASSSNGRVVGHPALTVRPGETTTITFAANSGFTLDGVGGTCGGSVRGNTYAVQNTYGDCTAIPYFKAVASTPPTPSNRFNELLQTVQATLSADSDQQTLTTNGQTLEDDSAQQRAKEPAGVERARSRNPVSAPWGRRSE